VTLPSWWPHCFSSETWFSIWILVGDLVLDLDAAGAGLDHLLGQQVGRLGVAEAGVDVGDDRHHVRLEAVDDVDQLLLLRLVAGLPGGVEVAEHAAELAGVGLAQEGVELFDQRRDRGLLVHRLIRQRAELRAQRRDHPAGEIEVLPLGGLEVLLDGDELLLADEAMPAAQRLGVLARIGVIGRHVLAHDVGGVAGDLQAGLEAVLQPHTRHGLGADAVPSAALALDELAHLDDVVLVRHF
jgi:hypothetical protein